MQSFAKGLALCLAAAFVLLAVIGGINNFSPVPYWDMWDSYLGFYTRVSQGDWSAWWAQHNEHRIVLSRVLFWVDLAWLDGTGWLLILANYILIAMTVALFWTILKEKIASHAQPVFTFLLSAFLCIWLFSWIQHENLTWGFQSQFILAQLIPLTAFYCLYKASTRQGIHSVDLRWFIVTCLLGLASLGTMANGVLALPIMVITATVMRLHWRCILVLAALAVAGCLLYFFDYHSIAAHGSIKQALLEHPRQLTAYLLLYLGGPFYYFLEQGPKALRIAEAMGLFMILSCMYFAYNAVRKPRTQTLNLVLLAFLLYIGGTAVGTAGGRVVFGVHTSSRYMTPALMAWAALVILYAPYILSLYKRYRLIAFVPFFLLTILVAPSQLSSLTSDRAQLFERRVAALAISMGVHDAPQIHTIYPSAKTAIQYSEFPLEHELSIFGVKSISDSRRLIGQQGSQNSMATCQGQLDTVQRIVNENRYISVRGWMHDFGRSSTTGTVHIVDKQGTIVGYALLGERRPDIGAEYNGFKGYLLAEKLGENLIVQGIEPNCAFPASTPRIPYVMETVKLDPLLINATASQVAKRNEWIGTDFQETKIDGALVLGSYINSDEDRATITLNLNRGDSFYYRSGPTWGHQHLKINGDDSFTSVLPNSAGWSRLEFSDASLPEQFTAQLIDSGSAWGEWSAILLRTND